ncbi:MAG: murein hydrolase activator EnvC [Actinomycetota bacterium]
MGGLISAAAGATTGSELEAAKARLHQLESQISAENDQLDQLQGELNVLAGQIDEATGAYQNTQQEVMGIRLQLQEASNRYHELRDQLDQRAADAFMEGPATGLDVILGASTITDLTDRFEFLNSISEHDAQLAVEVENVAADLHQREAVLNKILAQQAAKLRELNAAQTQLDSKFEQARQIREDLAAQQNEVGGLVTKLQKKLKQEELAAALAAQRMSGGAPVNIGDNPFHYCPVGDPHAFSDSFGAPRYAGGYHPHAGNDIMASRGTPIYATFDGTAEADPNGLGGNAVIVHGAQGYTYNAHLDSYGQLGSVTTGTIVGYVGDSGDAQGGPTHDHFEWHPNVLPASPYRSSYGYTVINGDAIDPYPYLLQVC